MGYRRNIKRDRMSGRIYTVSGGAPNQPLVCIVADAFWSKGDEAWVTWLEPQLVMFKRAWFAAKDHRSLVDWIKQDRDEWKEWGSGARKTLPVSVLVDVSQSPAAAAIIDDLRDDQTEVEACKLMAGDDSALTEQRYVQSGTVSVGARWLVSWFDGRIAKTQADEARYGRPYVPDRIIASFADFEDAGPPLMTSEEVRSAMSAAETLVKRTAKVDTEALLSLSADEVVSCCVMLTLLAADRLPPATDYRPQSTQLYGPMPEHERRASLRRMVQA